MENITCSKCKRKHTKSLIAQNLGTCPVCGNAIHDLEIDTMVLLYRKMRMWEWSQKNLNC